MRDSRGFSLIELTVVLFIAALTAGVMLPRIGAGFRQLEDREFLQSFVQTLKSARLRAMSSGEVVSFRIRGEDHVYDLENPPERPIPPNVDIYADNLEQDPETNDKLVLFFPDGSMIGNNMEIVFDQSRAYSISIHPLFGSVLLSRVEAR